MLIDATRSKDILYTPDSFCSSAMVGTATRTRDLFSCISLYSASHLYANSHITIIMHLNDLVDTA